MVICNALYFKNMTVNLIPPMMMRIVGLEINECPKFLSNNPSESDYSIYFLDTDLRIPMTIEGIISYIPTRTPTKDELERYSGEYLLLTPNLSDWNPHTHEYRDQEYVILDYNGYIKADKFFLKEMTKGK